MPGFDLALFSLGLALFAVSIFIFWQARKRDRELLPCLEQLVLALSRIEMVIHDEAARTRAEGSQESRSSIGRLQESTLTMLSTMADLERDQLEQFALQLAASTEEMRRMVELRTGREPLRKEAVQSRPVS